MVNNCSEKLKFYIFFYLTVLGMPWCCENYFEVMVFCNMMVCSLVGKYQCV